MPGKVPKLKQQSSPSASNPDIDLFDGMVGVPRTTSTTLGPCSSSSLNTIDLFESMVEQRSTVGRGSSSSSSIIDKYVNLFEGMVEQETRDLRELESVESNDGDDIEPSVDDNDVVTRVSDDAFDYSVYDFGNVPDDSDDDEKSRTRRSRPTEAPQPSTTAQARRHRLTQGLMGVPRGI